jgi:DNA-binding LytR/AlgR family response regulator
LADGQSFEIFNRVQLKCPVVFTTAYDEFALKAFKVNSLDYLLKPIDKDELKNAFDKFKSFRPQQSDLELNIKNLLANIQIPQVESFKDRFLVKSGQKLVSVSENDIAYFLSQDKLTYLLTHAGNKYVVDYTLDDLDALLNPKTFFRLNRQVFSSLQSINSVHTYFNGKLKIDVTPKYADELIVSRERAPDFKAWLGA